MVETAKGSLAKQIGDMIPGDHACLIYDNQANQMAAILPFVKTGLEKNESCLYIANDHSVEDVENLFSSYGIDAKREQARGALVFSRNNMSCGDFNPQGMVEALKKLVERARANGFAGFRAAGEMTWVLGEGCGCEHLIKYEALLEEQFPTTLTGICQYNRKKFSSHIIRDIIRSHPVLIVEDKICRNLYCEARKFVEDKDNDFGVGWMLDNLIRFHTLEENLRHMIGVRDDFLSVVSHELNTPLTALKLQSDVQQRETETLSHDEWRDFNSRNLRKIDQLIHLVQSMLDVTRMSKRDLRLKLQNDVNLVDIFSEQAEAVAPLASIEVCRRDPLLGCWDRNRIAQVVANLLSNAIKFGKGHPIAVDIYDEKGMAKFSVRDQGIGISPKDQKRIFSLYERAVPFTNISGLGIGLFISKQIVLAHGGTLEVESEVGKGSTFHVALPLRGV